MFSKDLFAGAKILVTGGGTGLGREMADMFLGLGAEVAICGRRLGVCEATAEELMRRHGGKVTAHELDIGNAEAVDAVIGSLFAAGPLTGLVNNAAGNFIARTEDVSSRGFDVIARTVMHGSFYVTNAVGRRWIAAGLPGTVLSITTTWVRNGGPFTVPSAMSKAAVHAMTMSLAAEWGRHGIRLNGIAPGEIPTEGMNRRLTPGDVPGARMAATNPLGRAGRFEDIRNLAAFLMSPGASWISGETVALDGANALATGGNFYELRHWTGEDWAKARSAIERHNRKDAAQRGAPPSETGRDALAAGPA